MPRRETAFAKLLCVCILMIALPAACGEGETDLPVASVATPEPTATFGPLASATPSATTALLPTLTPEPTATTTPTVVPPTVTPLPQAATLTPDEQTAVLAALMDGNRDCPLPCWWGIIPGESELEPTLQRLADLGVRVGSSEAGITGADNLLVYLEFETQDGVVNSVEVSSGYMMGTAAETAARSQTFIQGWQDYSLKEMFGRYGLPSRAFLFSPFRADPGGGPSYRLYLFYEPQGIVVQYRGDAEELQGESYRACLDLNSMWDIQLFLYDPNSIDSMVNTILPPDSISYLGEADEAYAAIDWPWATGMSLEALQDALSSSQEPVCVNFSRDGVAAITETVTNAPTHVAFNPILALMGRARGDRFDEVALYDTAIRTLTLIAEDIENEVFNAPLWSPQGDWLAFVQSDKSIGLYNPGEKLFEELELASTYAPVEQGQAISVHFGGWSFDSNWLAYQYLNDQFIGESYLLDRHNGQSYPLGFPTSLIWMEWSPRTTQLAGFTYEAIYIAELSRTADVPGVEVVAQHQRMGQYIGRIAWHPNNNGLLVSTFDMHNLSSLLGTLWYLDLDSGEWTFMGRYPSIVAIAYSPDLAEIAIASTNYATKGNWLIVIDAEDFGVITQIELPTEQLFSPIDWLDADTVVLSGGDNMYVLPVRASEQGYWLLDPDLNPLVNAYSSVSIRDWR